MSGRLRGTCGRSIGPPKGPAVMYETANTNRSVAVQRLVVVVSYITAVGVLRTPTSAPRSAPTQGGASPLQACALRPETNGNCAAVRRGGEQPTVMNQSVG